MYGVNRFSDLSQDEFISKWHYRGNVSHCCNQGIEQELTAHCHTNFSCIYAIAQLMCVLKHTQPCICVVQTKGVMIL